MSIWCSSLIGKDPHSGDHEPVDVPVQVRSYATGWSNHYPTTDGSVERDACVDLAHIPAWCAGGEDDDFESVGGWLRLGVHSWQHHRVRPSEVVGEAHASVVLDEAAVRALVEQMNEWLERPKVAPAVQPPASPGETDANVGAERARAERWAPEHPDDTFVDLGDGDWKLIADDGHVLDWGPR